MQFNSLSFLIFFPAVTVFYFAIPHRLRYIWILVMSYFFYMCWNPKYALLIAASTLITYFSGLLLSRAGQSPGRRRLWVALSFSSNLAILIFYKYFGFLLKNVNAVLESLHIQLIDMPFDVLLPVGISFYTFQALSYTMDVYRGNVPVERNVLKYALFVSFFPQLVAGPIERSKNLLSQIDELHTFDTERVKNGLLRMLWGFFLKLVIADRAALLINQVFDHADKYAGFQIALAAVLFAFQIYCDFGGYSSIAIGSAQVMGFRLMENFRQPYFAISVKDFWSRWHISLSTWFRDYLYIPLGGNRKGRWRTSLNVMITFLVSGLWHGASWNFVVWGGLHGLYQVVGGWLKPWRERMIARFKVNTSCFSYRLSQSLITFALVDFAWIFFRANGAKNALFIINRMFSSFNVGIFVDGSLYKLGMDLRNFNFLVVALFLLLAASLLSERDGDVLIWLAKQNAWFRYACYWLVLTLVLFSTNLSSQEFVYFQF